MCVCKLHDRNMEMCFLVDFTECLRFINPT